MFSKFFINRPIFATVVSIIIVIAGMMAIKGLPIEEYPKLTPPQISVSAVYTGADAQTIADSVASAIEDQINGVENMLYMQSTSSSPFKIASRGAKHGCNRARTQQLDPRGSRLYEFKHGLSRAV